MNDVFKEQIVSRVPTMLDSFKKAGIILLVLILDVVVATFIPQLLTFAVMGFAFGGYVLFGLFKVEYEYIFTNGDLDVDCIYNKSRRKRMYSGDVKNIEIMVHINDMGYENDFSKAKKKRDCTSGKYGDNTYKFLVSQKDVLTQVIIEPNDAMLQAMSPYLGQRRFIRKK